jgi:FtsP/CotA-like multicopper oxidase with cupredoxin domain
MSDPHGKKKKESQEKEPLFGKVSRRTMLKMGAATGALTILTSRKSLNAYAQGGVAEPATPLCNQPPAGAPTSPATTPFLDNLPIPLPAIPTILNPAPTQNQNVGGGEAPRAPHQRWNQFLPDVKYLLEAKAATHQFHANLLPSYIWGFNGRYPSPTVLNAYGHPTIVRFKNSLPNPTNSFGTPVITIHLHNGHTSPESDGFAQDFFSPSGVHESGIGVFKDNHYANAYAGIDQFGGIGDPRERMGTFWFHDHTARETANNNYLGLNGMYLMYDAKDPGHEFNTPGSLRLPNFYGITDIPLILGERRFCPTAVGGRNELFQVIGAAAPTGDKWVVNGKIQPKFAVRRRKYRFRILNTGTVKTFNIRLVGPDGNQKPWTVVAVDANFLHEPWEISGPGSGPNLPNGDLQIPVASRYDIIIDFKQFAVGDKVYIREAQAQNVTAGGPALPDPALGLQMVNVLMRFDVVGNTIIPDTPAIPSTLIDMPPVPTPAATFNWTFKLVGGVFLVNDEQFSANDPAHCVLRGTAEEWNLQNNLLPGNWVHPVHIHFEEGRILERTTRLDPVNQPDVNTPVALNPDEATANSRRDVYILPGQHTVKMRQAFRDFTGRYLIHCHNMGHEDNFMMARWDIVDTPEELCRVQDQIIRRRMEKGLDVTAQLKRVQELERG